MGLEIHLTGNARRRKKVLEKIDGTGFVPFYANGLTERKRNMMTDTNVLSPAGQKGGEKRLGGRHKGHALRGLINLSWQSRKTLDRGNISERAV